MRVTILGCGGSHGVPLIGNDWGNCDPKEPRNRRRRVSILVEQGDTRILVDTSPDLRQQLLDAGVSRLTAIVYTHAHADHLHGIDELRAINYHMKAQLPVYAMRQTIDEIERRFGYVFEPIAPGFGFYRPALVPHVLDGRLSLDIGGIPVTWFRQDHGVAGATTGFRFGKVAYSTDVQRLPEEAFKALEGVELWVVDCLRDAPHPTHAHFDLTMQWIARVKPRRAILTHMSQETDYRTLLAKCPPGVEPGYDGMVVEA